MLFNSSTFLVFLGVTVVIYYLIPHRIRWLLLLVSSYYFYMSQQASAGIWLVLATVSAYLCGLGIAKHAHRKKTFLVLGLVFNLGMLVVLKYFNFISSQLGILFKSLGVIETAEVFPQLGLAYPAGLSFYAFSITTYLVDLYRGEIKADKDPRGLAVYIAFFPKILAGPIERAQTFLPQMEQRVRFDYDRFHAALFLILWGLFKKLVIADRLAVFVNDAFGNPDYSPPIKLFFASYFFAIQIYCDFSGYTDIARGTSKLMGFNLMENFTRPYLSKSPSEFWGSRWHYSLASWFRDYLYIPLGGNRVSWPRRYFNLMAVFIVSGIWHAGLGYDVSYSLVIWGLLNGFYIWFAVFTTGFWRRLGEIMPRIKGSLFLTIIRIVITFHLITFAWIFFRAGTIKSAWTIISRIGQQIHLLPSLIKTFKYTTDLQISFGLIVLLIIIEIFDERKPIWERLNAMPTALRWSVYYVLIFSLLIGGQWELSEFIYMQF